MIVRVEFTVCPGSQPMRLQKIETDEGLVDITKLGMKNSDISLTEEEHSFEKHVNPQLSSIVLSQE